jgi:hypothetical protein
LYKDQYVEAGTVVQMDLYVQDEVNLYGLQFDLSLSGGDFIDLQGQSLAKAAQYNIPEDKQSINISWAEAEGVQVQATGKLFQIVWLAEKSGYISNLINLGTQMNAEAYLTEALKIHNIQLISMEQATSSAAIHWNLQPNPASDQVQLFIELPFEEAIQLKISNAVGQTLYSKNIELKAGKHVIPFSIKKFEAGGDLLFVRLEGQHFKETQKLVRIR